MKNQYSHMKINGVTSINFGLTRINTTNVKIFKILIMYIAATMMKIEWKNLMWFLLNIYY